jgi:hypothetical protein
VACRLVTVMMMVMMPVTKPQDQVGPTIVRPVVVAITTPTMDGSPVMEMAMPPTTMWTPPTTPMVAVGFGDQCLIYDGVFA